MYADRVLAMSGRARAGTRWASMIVVVMGVSGCGKTRSAGRSPTALGWPFHDADDFPPRGNVAKMAAGEALTDDTGRPWLDRLARQCVPAGRRRQRCGWRARR